MFSTLFVMGMEVLTAYLGKYCSASNFKYHWRTKQLNITHITFADDILLFSYGDQCSIDKLLEGLFAFSSCSGMQINPQKSQFFVANVGAEIIEHIQRTTGFTQGSLPVRYLGLPLITSKLSLRHCMPLIMRIRDRIDSWVNICLNHAGRLQLIKVVLSGILHYWSAHMFLPVGVLKKIQRLFVKFLWGGSSANSKLVKVSWSACCFPKSEGGLGLRDLCQWNKSAFIFQIWRIIQPSADSLWIAWFKASFLKRKSLWTLNIPSKVSWCVRKLLLLRKFAMSHIHYKVGSNSSFLFWQDPWLDGVAIASSCHPSLPSIAESNLQIKVSHYIANSSWNLPLSNHLLMQELRTKILPTVIHRSDSITWHNLGVDSVNTSQIWDTIRRRNPPPPWLNIVWNSFSIPKCSFTLWLVLKGRLLTKDRMRNFRMNTDLRCLLCSDAIESHEHLFGSCRYITEILNRSSFSFSGVWSCYRTGLVLLNRPTGIRRLVGLLFFAITIFMVWKERNARLHNSLHHNPASITCTMIKRMLREKLHTCKKFKASLLRDPNLVLDIY